MKYTIKNDCLSVTLESFGAELRSIQTTDGTEYLWQGNPDIWKGQAPNLFPYIARLTDGKYTCHGKEYEMKRHGFINSVELTAEEVKEDAITFRFDSNEETLKQYPFQFTYRITYALRDKVLTVTNQVENRGEGRMYFGIGGHPGFNVPLEEGLTFEDYFLEFSEKAHPWRVGFTPDCHPNGQDEAYPLEEGRRIPLHHDLFDNDAIVLKHADRQVTIRSDRGSRAVRVSYPDYSIIGFWHMNYKEAPYVCVEPWSSLPSRAGIVEELTQQSDLISLPEGKTYQNAWTIEIIE